MFPELNVRKVVRLLRNGLFLKLNQCTSVKPIVLIVQPRVLPLLNSICSFSQLTEETRVNLIIILNDDCASNIRELDLTGSKLVILIDLRADLIVPPALSELLKVVSIEAIDIIYATFEGHKNEKEDLSFPNHLQLQLPDVIAELHPWNVLPICYFDDNLLNCNILVTSDGQNLYYPKTASLAETTRGILVDHLVKNVAAICHEYDLTITQSISLGNHSRTLVERLREELLHTETYDAKFTRDVLYGKKHSGLQTNLIVLERSVDPLTPLLSQLTYSGMLYDLFGVTLDNKLKNIKEKDVLEDAADESHVAVDYTSDDIWHDLKFANFGAVGSKLNNWAKDLKDHYESRHQVETVGEIKQFVDSLGELQRRQRLLKLHTGISSKIMETVNKGGMFQEIIDIEQDFCMNNLDNKVSCEKILDLMYSGAPLDIILRLCSLLSVTKNGIRDKDFIMLKTEIVDTFGIESLLQLERLTSYGYLLNKSMFPERSHIKDFHSLSTWYDLCPQLDKTIDPLNPKEPTFALCGVIPLSVRLLESMYDRSVLLQHYSSQQPFVISRTPTLTKMEQIFESQYGLDPLEELVWDQSAESKTRIIGSPEKTTDLVFVVYVGGITLAEVATIKFLQETLRSKNINKRFIVITDGVISSKTIPQL